jgi:hypothetical protein
VLGDASAERFQSVPLSTPATEELGRRQEEVFEHGARGQTGRHLLTPSRAQWAATDPPFTKGSSFWGAVKRLTCGRGRG